MLSRVAVVERKPGAHWSPPAANIVADDPQRLVRHWRATVIGRMSAFGVLSGAKRTGRPPKPSSAR
ncbi:hypothetical protein AYJ54_06145 [Bradyrhizobium centrolobii]|uniref:Uncharacterized protein n=1 Tax=Bradyrhizobium centrolobii TaxID=1505087 RepID=A0A176Z059_9BRAD|nr:hypothetical protein AYJ54_06145 [Bradyrhizobium centrolobii]